MTGIASRREYGIKGVRVIAENINMKHKNKKSQKGMSFQLTPEEEQIMQKILLGLSNDGIAEALAISPHAVKEHITNIYKKLGVINRFQAILWAQKNL